MKQGGASIQRALRLMLMIMIIIIITHGAAHSNKLQTHKNDEMNLIYKKS